VIASVTTRVASWALRALGALLSGAGHLVRRAGRRPAQPPRTPEDR